MYSILRITELLWISDEYSYVSVSAQIWFSTFYTMFSKEYEYLPFTISCSFILNCSNLFLVHCQVFCRAGFSGYESSSTAASKTKSASPQLRFRASHFAAGDPLFNAATLSTTQKPLVLPELVIERLQRFPLALRTYLEFLVYEEKIEVRLVD